MVQQEDCALWGKWDRGQILWLSSKHMDLQSREPRDQEMYGQSRLVCADSIQDHLSPLHSKRGAERTPRELPEEPQCLKEMFSGLA